MWTLHCLVLLPLVVLAAPAQFRRITRDAKKSRWFEFPDLQGAADLPQLTLMLDPTASDFHNVYNVSIQVAETFSSEKLAVVLLRADFASALKFFKIKAGEIPTVVIVNWTNGIGQRPYQLYLHSQGEPGRLTVPELQGFGQMFLRGEVTQWFRSAPVVDDPVQHDSKSGALEIVGSQFQRLVIDDQKDVLVMFFAPWCGFSKRMQPRINEFARRTQQFYRYFAVLKIDDTRNDVDHPVMMRLTGYPFLAFFPAGKKAAAEQIPVDGRLLGDSEAWLQEAMTKLQPLATHSISLMSTPD